MQEYSFPKTCRLLKSFEFREVSKGGRRHYGRLLTIHWTESPKAPSKLGITVTKKFGKSHERNLFKRRIREIFRQTSPSLFRPLNMNVRPLEGAKNAGWDAIKAELVCFFDQFSELATK